MLNRLPVMILPLQTLLDDIGNPKPRELARALGVTERDIAQWLKADEAPRPVMLALFWLTRWGQSAVDCEAHNLAVLHRGIAESLRTEVATLNRKLVNLGRIADFGAANDPAQGVELPKAVPPLPTAPTAAPIWPRRAATASTARPTGESIEKPGEVLHG